MSGYIAVLTILLMLAMVLVRALMLRRQGVHAVKFGKIDPTDFVIPPFAFFYFYLIFAAVFGWPTVSHQIFFRSNAIAWAGTTFCLAGLLMLLWSLISFGRSFRIGIDIERPDALVTTGVFAFSRNPIYVAFAAILLGQFLILPNWLLAVYLMAAIGLFHRQILREERFLAQHYGPAYAAYAERVRRYL